LVGTDLCSDPDAICRDPEVAFATSIYYWVKKVQNQYCKQTGGRMLCSFKASIDAIAPADRTGDVNRRAAFKEFLDAAGIAYHQDPDDIRVYPDEVSIRSSSGSSTPTSTPSGSGNEVLKEPAYCAQNECATCIVNTSYDFTKPDAHAVTDEQCSNCISGNTANWPCNKQFHCGCTPKSAAPPAVFPPETCQRSPGACGSCGVNESTLELPNAHLVSAEQCSKLRSALSDRCGFFPKRRF
jgi:hypothetical protein